MRYMKQWWRTTMHERRLGWQLWWLSQQVEFLEWRMRFESMLPEPSIHDTTETVGPGGYDAMRALS
ncbi:MAG: hypothetical protein ACT4OO_10805 [Nitrospiraceae bacterium]